MNITNQIINFDAASGSVLVRYLCAEDAVELVYSIDVPVIDGAFVSQVEMQQIIDYSTPRAQLERIVLLKTTVVPDWLLSYVLPEQVEPTI